MFDVAIIKWLVNAWRVSLLLEYGVNATYPVVVVSSKLADYTIGEPSTFNFAKVDREKWYGSMRKPASAGFLIVKNIMLNSLIAYAKRALNLLTISLSQYTVYLYSICVRC